MGPSSTVSRIITETPVGVAAALDTQQRGRRRPDDIARVFQEAASVFGDVRGLGNELRPVESACDVENAKFVDVVVGAVAQEAPQPVLLPD